MAREQVDFLFFEMDCFLLQHPLRAVKGHVVDADLYISLHQDNPFEFNVGYYFVRAGTTASGRDPLAADRAERRHPTPARMNQLQIELITTYFFRYFDLDLDLQTSEFEYIGSC